MLTLRQAASRCWRDISLHAGNRTALMLAWVLGRGTSLSQGFPCLLFRLTITVQTKAPILP